MKNMTIRIKGNNIKVTDSLREYVEEKIGRLTKYYDRLQTAEVELLVQDNKSAEESQKVEVTLTASGTVFRCEEASISMYASIDIVSEKLVRQLKKYKTKLNARAARANKQEGFAELDQEDAPEEQEPRIVKVKRFSVKPMSPLEASLQMDMLNHDFYVFLNDESEQLSVIYKRADGDIGLIEPDFT